MTSFMPAELQSVHEHTIAGKKLSLMVLAIYTLKSRSTE